MSDNRTTELLRELRRMLEKCRRTEEAGFDTYWITAVALDTSLDELEQAIAATLGSGTLTAEQVRDAVLENFEEAHETRYDHWKPSKFDWQAIADELNATLGSGECEIYRVGNTQDVRKCSACGKLMHFNHPLDRDCLNYCPNCGKAVKR